MDLRRQFTRRSILASLAGALSAIVSACSGPSGLESSRQPKLDTATTATMSPVEPPTEPTATITGNLPPETPDDSATSNASQIETPATQPASTGSSLVPVARPALRPSLPREVHIPFAAVVSPKLQVRDLSYDQLVDVWNLRIDNWRELGDPISSPVRRYTLPNTALPIDPFGGDVQFGSIDELARALWNDRGGIAIIETRDVDHRFRTLRVDGIDTLRSRGAPNPLLLQMFGVPEEIAPRSLLPRNQPAKLTFVGDIIFGRYVQVALEQRNDFAASFRSVANRLRDADITIGNLECTLSDNFEQPERANPQTFRFKTGTVTVEGLELADIDILGRANNHSFDFGEAGMNDTSRTLEKAGILHFGMGANLTKARQPVIYEVGDLSFAFLGYNGISDFYDGATSSSPGTSPMVEDYVVADVQQAVADGHIVIPFFHWGIEYVSMPTEEQQRFAHIAIDEGASIVIGSHPHWVQAIETYNGRPIVYSLGNYVFDQAWSRETTEGLIAELWFEGSTVKGLDLVPVLIVQEHRPVVLDEDSAYHVLERVWAASEQLRPTP